MMMMMMMMVCVREREMVTLLLRVWNHMTHHRVVGLVNPGFVLVFGLFVQEDVTFFLRKATWLD